MSDSTRDDTLKRAQTASAYWRRMADAAGTGTPAREIATRTSATAQSDLSGTTQGARSRGPWDTLALAQRNYEQSRHRHGTEDRAMRARQRSLQL
jgi:hypothetical protein